MPDDFSPSSNICRFLSVIDLSNYILFRSFDLSPYPTSNVLCKTHSPIIIFLCRFFSDISYAFLWFDVSRTAWNTFWTYILRAQQIFWYVVFWIQIFCNMKLAPRVSDVPYKYNYCSVLFLCSQQRRTFLIIFNTQRFSRSYTPHLKVQDDKNPRTLLCLGEFISCHVTRHVLYSPTVSPSLDCITAEKYLGVQL